MIDQGMPEMGSQIEADKPVKNIGELMGGFLESSTFNAGLTNFSKDKEAPEGEDPSTFEADLKEVYLQGPRVAGAFLSYAEGLDFQGFDYSSAPEEFSAGLNSLDEVASTKPGEGEGFYENERRALRGMAQSLIDEKLIPEDNVSLAKVVSLVVAERKGLVERENRDNILSPEEVDYAKLEKSTF